MNRSAGEPGFDDFYAATARRVIQLVYATTGDLTLAQDCTQEAYARAWERWGSVGTMAEPLSWVRTVARRLAISRWRSRQAESAAYRRAGESPAVVASPNPDRLAIVDALQSLPADERDAVALYYLADLSVAQVAAETGAPQGTVKARLHHGRRHLAAVLVPKEAHHG